ncbi:MAG: hypothetical protein K5907_06550 [Treponema sp.]|nr:hypothetical protein [Treponema sp.]
MNKIAYIGHCVPENFSEKRLFSAAANAVIWYISNSLHQLGYNITLYSVCFGDIKKSKGNYHNIKIDNGYNVIVLPFLNYCNKYTRLISKIVFKIIRFVHLFFAINKNDVIIVYHSLELMNLIKIIKKIKGNKLIIEVGEIYGDYWQNPSIIKNEMNYFKFADAFIFQSEKLELLINVDNKPYVINYGSYKTIDMTKEIKDDKIHCIYSGTFDPKKGGVELAIRTASFLSEKYIMHISGYGSKEQIEKIQNFINDINKKSKCHIVYEGLLNNTAYEQLLSKCIWGLNTQTPDANFNETCFPSKILMYLGHGLNVVSSKIPVVENSEIGQYLTYYNEQDPKNIAETILNTKIRNQNENIVKHLDDLFKLKLKEIINDL